VGRHCILAVGVRRRPGGVARAPGERDERGRQRSHGKFMERPSKRRELHTANEDLGALMPRESSLPPYRLPCPLAPFLLTNKRYFFVSKQLSRPSMERSLEAPLRTKPSNAPKIWISSVTAASTPDVDDTGNGLKPVAAKPPGIPAGQKKRKKTARPSVRLQCRCCRPRHAWIPSFAKNRMSMRRRASARAELGREKMAHGERGRHAPAPDRTY